VYTNINRKQTSRFKRSKKTYFNIFFLRNHPRPKGILLLLNSSYIIYFGTCTCEWPSLGTYIANTKGAKKIIYRSTKWVSILLLFFLFFHLSLFSKTTMCDFKVYIYGQNLYCVALFWLSTVQPLHMLNIYAILFLLR